MIIFPCRNPETLLLELKAAIDSKKIKSWSYDADGDFTCEIETWNQQAWLRPTITEDGLRLNIVPPLKTGISTATYAVYHGRFIETVLRLFDHLVEGNASVSALPVEPDEVDDPS